jgi:MFS family permease|tara:strand:- start:148 stop:1410 length:1263 start_codon:yes stop_codon:yes gene_type:complete
MLNNISFGGYKLMHKKFYGWRIVGAAGLINFFSIGLPFYAFSVFYIHLQEEFNASRFLISSTLSILIIAGGIFAPICGHLVDRYSIKKMLSLGSLLFGVGLIALGFCQNYYQFLIVYGTILSLGITLFGNLSTAKLISFWFNKKNGTAIGYAALGISLSGVFIPPVAVYLISIFDWRITYMIFGTFILLFMTPFCRIFITNKPSDINQNVDGVELSASDTSKGEVEVMDFWDIIKVPAFWILIIIFSLQFCANLGVYSHIFPYVTDLGFDIKKAGYAVSVGAFGAAIGKVVFGKLIDIFSARITLWISIIIQGIGILLVSYSSSYNLLLLSVLAMSLGLGGSVPLMNILFSKTFSPINFGKALGLAVPFMVPIQVIGGPLSGWLFDTFGNYDLAFSLNSGVCFIAFLFVFMLNVPSDKHS